MLKKEKNSLVHILCRLATVSEDDPHGPQEKRIWLHGYLSRIKMLGGWPDGLTLKTCMSLDWDNGGHFQMVPKMEADANPAEHRYQAFTLMGNNFPFTGPLASAVTGEWQTYKNWDHCKAYVCHPKYPKFSSTFKSFLEEFLQSMIKPLTWSAAPDTRATPGLEIEDFIREPINNILKLVLQLCFKRLYFLYYPSQII